MVIPRRRIRQTAPVHVAVIVLQMVVISSAIAPEVLVAQPEASGDFSETVRAGLPGSSGNATGGQAPDINSSPDLSDHLSDAAVSQSVLLEEVSYQEAVARVLAVLDPLQGEPPPRRSLMVRRGGSLGRVVLDGIFGFYGRVLSSQDGSPCGFSPSCSTFGWNVIRRFGAVRGILLTIDRLQRDHPYRVDYYPLDMSTGLAVDPVNHYCVGIRGGCR